MSILLDIKTIIEEKLEMKDFIDEELFEVDGNGHCCEHECLDCSEIEFCHSMAVQQMSHEFAESINYGGYDTEEEFWEQI